MEEKLYIDITGNNNRLNLIQFSINGRIIDNSFINLSITDNSINDLSITDNSINDLSSKLFINLLEPNNNFQYFKDINFNNFNYFQANDFLNNIGYIENFSKTKNLVLTSNETQNSILYIGDFNIENITNIFLNIHCNFNEKWSQNAKLYVCPGKGISEYEHISNTMNTKVNEEIYLGILDKNICNIEFNIPNNYKYNKIHFIIKVEKYKPDTIGNIVKENDIILENDLQILLEKYESLEILESNNIIKKTDPIYEEELIWKDVTQHNAQASQFNLPEVSIGEVVSEEIINTYAELAGGVETVLNYFISSGAAEYVRKKDLIWKDVTQHNAQASQFNLPQVSVGEVVSEEIINTYAELAGGLETVLNYFISNGAAEYKFYIIEEEKIAWSERGANVKNSDNFGKIYINKLNISAYSENTEKKLKYVPKWNHQINYENLKDSYDYIIVGAGWAGCMAAYELSRFKPNSKVLLIEGGLRYNPYRFTQARDVTPVINLLKTDGGPIRGSYTLLGGSGALNYTVDQRIPKWYVEEENFLGKYLSPDQKILFHECIDDFQNQCCVPLRKGFNSFGGVSNINYFDKKYFAQFKEKYFPDWITPDQVEFDEKGGYGSTLYKDVQNCTSNTLFNKSMCLKTASRYEDDSRSHGGSVLYNLNTTNLDILDSTFVYNIEFDNKKAIKLNTDKGPININGELILTGGVYSTPGLLQHSGIGPKHVLEKINVKPLESVPLEARENVGKNFGMSMYLNRFFPCPYINLDVIVNDPNLGIYGDGICWFIKKKTKWTNSYNGENNYEIRVRLEYNFRNGILRNEYAEFEVSSDLPEGIVEANTNNVQKIIPDCSLGFQLNEKNLNSFVELNLDALQAYFYELYYPSNKIQFPERSYYDHVYEFFKPNYVKKDYKNAKVKYFWNEKGINEILRQYNINIKQFVDPNSSTFVTTRMEADVSEPPITPWGKLIYEELNGVISPQEFLEYTKDSFNWYDIEQDISPNDPLIIDDIVAFVVNEGELLPGELGKRWYTQDIDFIEYMKWKIGVITQAHDSIHYQGSCIIGKVLNNDFKIKGIDNVTVADLSVLPKLLPGNTGSPAGQIGSYIVRGHILKQKSKFLSDKQIAVRAQEKQFNYLYKACAKDLLLNGYKELLNADYSNADVYGDKRGGIDRNNLDNIHFLTYKMNNHYFTHNIEEMALQGITTNYKKNQFLITIQEYIDFELKFKVKTENNVNSGLQVLSYVDEYEAICYGPQVEIDDNDFGAIYDEGITNDWLFSPNKRLNLDKVKYKKGDWNQFHIRVTTNGNNNYTIIVFVNNVLITNYNGTLTNMNLPEKNRIGFQIHFPRNNDELNKSVYFKHVIIKDYKPTVINQLVGSFNYSFGMNLEQIYENLEEQQNLLNSLFEQILVINLIESEIGKQRWNLIKENKLLGNFITRYEGFDGQKDYSYYLENNIIEENYTINNNTIYLSKGEIGINISFYKILNYIVDNNIEKILILEDDALSIDSQFTFKLDNYLKKLPENYDIALLGFYLFSNDYLKEDLKYNEDVYRVKQFILMHAYILTLEGAKNILNLLPINLPLEIFLSKNSDILSIYRHNYVTNVNLYGENEDKLLSTLINQYSSNSEIVNRGGHTILSDANLVLL